MSFFRKSVLTLLLIIPTVSNAEFFDLTATAWDSDTHSLISNQTIPSDAFTDEWNFTLTDPDLLSSSSGFVTDGFFVSGIEDFHGYLISDSIDPLYFKADKADLSNTYLSLAELLQSSTPLTPGNYSFVLEGISSESGGYYGESEISKVPVPGSIWLMGSGFAGLVSLMKRKTRNSAH